ncbi:hypothetical protein CDAR_464401 [Caerostris darwini]|uniref:Uncharacterized protein n=1 Tax=Caerostris darwini TaxID=1538125 RepID=A0AAV4VU22_9ARAC|nr:hypothetical protein CDAR_464401 [Caerostris darwini]
MIKVGGKQERHLNSCVRNRNYGRVLVIKEEVHKNMQDEIKEVFMYESFKNVSSNQLLMIDGEEFFKKGHEQCNGRSTINDRTGKQAPFQTENPAPIEIKASGH